MSEADSRGEGVGRVVLIVEDEPQVLRFLRASLSAHGYRVLEAASGEQGLVEAATRSPDIVLLDLGLPDLDGVEVARRLREWSAVPVIVLSARGQESGQDQGARRGGGRLPDEALRRGRAARPDASASNAARVAAGAGEASFEVGELRVDLAARRVFLRDEEAPPDADRVQPARDAGEARREGRDAPPAAARGRARVPPASRTTCASTSASCGTSSSRTRRGRGTC